MIHEDEITPFQKTLDATLREYNPFNYLGSKNRIKILDIGCASASEISLFRKYSNGRAHVTGIDQSEASINVAKQEYPTDIFIPANALEILSGLPKDFDMVVMLHPEIYHNYDFRRILEMSPNNLNESGIFFSSLYSEREFQVMPIFLGFTDYKTIVAERNKAQPKEDFLVPFQYIIVARKMQQPQTPSPD